MLRFRLIVTWLLLAALPLQGWAAATMLWCGPAQQPAALAAAHTFAHTAGHQHDDGHATQGAHGQHHVDAADVGSADDGAAPTLADDSHTCGVCAACCNGVALAQTPGWPSSAIVPRAEIAEPLVAVLARPSPVPDKPPRA